MGIKTVQVEDGADIKSGRWQAAICEARMRKTRAGKLL